MLTLHHMPATVSPAVAIVLEELALDYAPVLVDFKTHAQQGSAHLALNPKGRVPVLVCDAGVLTETGAILDWLAAVHGPHLVPDDPYLAARMREVMYYLASTMHVAHAHKLRGSRWANNTDSHADMTARVPQTMTNCCAYLESYLSLSPFVLGGTFTLADPYLFAVVRWAAPDGVDMTLFPKLSSHLTLMWDRLSVQSAKAKGLLI